VPANATGTIGLEVIATDNHGLTVADLFSVTFAAAAGHVSSIAVPGSADIAAQDTVSSPTMLTSAESWTFDHTAVNPPSEYG